MKLRTLTVLLCLAPALLLAGCKEAILAGGAGALMIFDRPDVNLAEKNYAAADYLMQQGANFVTKRDDIRATPLQNVSEPQLSTKIGRVISKQVGERLQQLGYQVDLNDVTADVETSFPYTENYPYGKPDFVLAGTYYNAGSSVEVKLRLVNTKTGELVGSFNYAMPMSWEIQRMTRPKPKIIRTTGQQPAQQKPNR